MAAETTNYLFLGLAVIFGALLIHLTSLFIRARALRSDFAFLQSLQKRKPSSASKRKKRK